jgi:hypothetical protein
MLEMLKRHEVEILLKAGHSKAEVTCLTGVSLRSVNRISEEAPVVHVDDAAEREKRQIGRPSNVESFRKFIVGILEETPDLPSLEILRRVREAAGTDRARISRIGTPELPEPTSGRVFTGEPPISRGLLPLIPIRMQPETRVPAFQAGAAALISIPW